jgi:hypothetical protein
VGVIRDELVMVFDIRPGQPTHGLEVHEGLGEKPGVLEATEEGLDHRIAVSDIDQGHGAADEAINDIIDVAV